MLGQSLDWTLKISEFYVTSGIVVFSTDFSIVSMSQNCLGNWGNPNIAEAFVGIPGISENA